MNMRGIVFLVVVFVVLPASAEGPFRTVGSAADADHLFRGGPADVGTDRNVFGTVTATASQTRPRDYEINTALDRAAITEKTTERFGSVTRTWTDARRVGKQLPPARTSLTLADLVASGHVFGTINLTRPLPETMGVRTLVENEKP